VGTNVVILGGAGYLTRQHPVEPCVGNLSQRETFSDLLVAQLPALRRFAIALSGNTALADDLVQDCIEKALRQSLQLRETRRLGSWLRTILYNLYIDELRRRRSAGIQQDVAELADELVLSVSREDPSSSHDFMRAISGLTPEHRQIVLLVGLEGMSYREIADSLAIPIGTVMSRLARARERLRELLDPVADDPVKAQQALRDKV
jgi:RNA polymerase sigma-70 factor (ECF subfamily)